MSYKALYRTYRPKSFDNVVGQDHIVSTLKNIIEKNKVSHAYLFAGPRGTGKTSVAHIFANVLNCSDSLDVKTACGKCEQCSQKVNMDIVEIDAASNNGVGEIRKLIDTSKYATSSSKYKVYIIDEVHMLSKGAFNALLKTLEEPPKHVIFILATTEAHKIPITILSRTQRFNFRRISNEAIEARLKNVLSNENISIDEESISLIARLSAGGMRDALSIADQVSAFTNGNITTKSISEVFGIVSTDNIIKLINSAFNNELKNALVLSNHFITEGSDISKLIETILDIAKDFIIFKKTRDAKLMSLLDNEKAQTIKMTNTFAYKILDTFGPLLVELKYSESPTQIFELALLKLIGDRNDPEPEVIVNEIEPEQIIEVVEPPKVVEEVIEPQPVQEVAQIKDETNIFDTQEVSIEEISDDNLTSEIQLENEQMDLESQIIEEEILNTQEISLDNLEKQIDSTDEIDILKMFQMDEQPKVTEQPKDVSYSVDELLNLLVQPNKQIAATIKQKASRLTDYSGRSEYGTYVTLLKDAKVITAGETFVLIAIENENIAREINSIRETVDFVEFINEVFGEYYLVFAITKEEFTKVKEAWQQAATIKKLPNPIPVQRPTGKPKQKTKAEEMGNKIFGDLFGA